LVATLVVGCDVDAGRRIGEHAFPNADGSRVGPHQSGDDVQHRRLACSVRAEQGEHLAGFDAQF